MPFTISDVYCAYRQAKTALFFEQRGIGLSAFARFEDRLPQSLERVLSVLNSSTGLFDDVPLGRVWLVPKRIDRAKQVADGTIRIGIHSHLTRPSLEVQVRLSPSVELAIAETFYLWQYGPALDALLAPACIGYRLDSRRNRMSRTRRWLYEYWPPRYQQFRTEPIKAAEAHLVDESRVVTIVSADLASFYDSVGTRFLLAEDFVDALKESAGRNNIRLNIAAYRKDTASLIRYYERFRADVSSRIGGAWDSGVPIGGLTSRLVANLALAPLDDWIRRQPATLLFRRYVDDIVIVCDGKDFKNESAADVITSLLPVGQSVDGTICLNSQTLGRPDSVFSIQSTKLKVHHLSGVAGQQFLASVENDFLSLVSERRAFLDGALVGDDAASHLARATGQDGSPLRVLRDADRVKLERFALSNSLRSLERISALVEAPEARDAARQTQSRIRTVIDGNADWFAHIDLLLRLLSLALTTDDRDAIRDLVSLSEGLWGEPEVLERQFATLTHRGRSIRRKRAWVTLRAYLDARRFETVATAVRPEHLIGEEYPVSGLRVGRRIWDARSILRAATRFAASDLRARDREDDQFPVRSSGRTVVELKELPFSDALRRRFATIARFVSVCVRLDDRPWAMPASRLFLLTRPPSYFDIARRILYQTERTGFGRHVFEDLLSVVNATRGTEYTDPVGRAVRRSTVQIPVTGVSEATPLSGSSKPQIILGNLPIDIQWWGGAATRVSGSPTGAPVLSLKRLLSINAVLKKAAEHSSRRATEQPGLLVLPELAVPRAWVRVVATHVANRLNMGLITGVEYLHDRQMPWVMNQAIGVFPGPYHAVATWPWTKRVPAREEAAQLAARKPPLSFRPKPKRAVPRVVVQSPYGDLSVLICSELIEARRIADLLGRVELVVIPSWNTDTASYDHLIQSAGLQLNAIVAIANNGTTSDCRAWAPLGERWRRELCRVIARGLDETIAVDLPLAELRAFRSAPDGSKEWRPMPPDWP